MATATNMEVANEILRQLGGRRFQVMTGAKNFGGTENSLSFRLPSTPHFVKNGINYVKITLTAADDYTVEFGRIHGVKYCVKYEAIGVYCDMLRECFTNHTGLETSLGTMGR